MICLIALFVFAVLGIFSVKYRILAKEAFDCVFRKITLRKCETGLNQRLKNRLTGKLFTKSPKFAGFIYKHFEIFSWVLTLLLICSVFILAQPIYNYTVYGNCNGPESDGFCIFDPLHPTCTCEDNKVTCSENVESACKGGSCNCTEGVC